jgi:hypothetical protein
MVVRRIVDNINIGIWNLPRLLNEGISMLDTSGRQK